MHKFKKTNPLFLSSSLRLGPHAVPAVVAVAAAHEPSREANHAEDDPDDQPDEGAGDEGEVLQEPARKRPRYGRRFQVGQYNDNDLFDPTN